MLNRLFLFFFIPLLMYIFVSGNISFLFFTEVVIMFALYELYDMFNRKGIEVYRYYGLLIAFLLPIVIFFKKNPVALLTVSVLVIATIQISTNKIEQTTKKLSFTYFGILYVGVSFSYILKIKELQNGGILLLFLFCLIWACDTFAYIFGISFGKHKFSKISPNKSIEGLIGGFLGVLAISISFEYIYYYISLALSRYIKYTPVKLHIFDLDFKVVIFAIIITALAVLGDLFESKLKREFGVKDSGTILLGHGGFLDRFDSALFVLPIAFYLLKYLIK